MQKGSPFLNSNFILNLFMAYELDNWPRKPTNNFLLKSLFDTAKLIRNPIKSK